jgi:transcriptional regulator with XRE-family HTH domain
VSERIKKIRSTLNLSQRAFAKEVYVSNGYLSEIETGHKDINDRLIYLITSTFSINKHWLLTGEGDMYSTTPEEKLEKISSLFYELCPEFQDFVLKQIDQLIEMQNNKREMM